MSDKVIQLQSAISELTLLNDLALAASSSLEVDRVLDLIVEKSIKAVKAEQGSIMLVSSKPDAPLQTLIRQADRTQNDFRYKVGSHISGWVLKYRKPLLINDLSSDDRFKVTDSEAKTIQTLLAVPISFKGDLIGILIMTNKRNTVSFTLDDQRLLTIIAAQSAQLIRNSQLQSEALEKKRLAHQLELAQNMQLQLLPDKDPDFPDLDISAFFKPHKSVSGDYYDYFKIAEKQLGVVIADVSGHGPSAALVMTLVKGILHSLIHRYESPAQVLTEANNIMQKIIPADVFVTMSFLLFNLAENQLTYANAGHTPLLVFNHTNNKSVIVAAEDCPLNTLPNYKYKNFQLEFVPMDSFLIYTDGLSESTNNSGEMYGISRLGQVLENFCKRSSGEMISQIILEVDAYLGDQEYSDDMLIMAVKIMD